MKEKFVVTVTILETEDGLCETTEAETLMRLYSYKDVKDYINECIRNAMSNFDLFEYDVEVDKRLRQNEIFLRIDTEGWHLTQIFTWKKL
jgi:hypothetical protein